MTALFMATYFVVNLATGQVLASMQADKYEPIEMCYGTLADNRKPILARYGLGVELIGSCQPEQLDV